MANPDDDKTVFDSAAPADPPADGENSLPAGTRLAEFEIIDLVGIGGFGIVYLAQDHSLGRRVALKEYMPSSLASRGEGLRVNVKSQRNLETFEAGRRSFVNEARLLAQFDHPALVKVYRFWEANGTAYMVMPYYDGITLKRALRQMPAPPDEGWLRHLLAPLLDALEVMHGAKVFHRDVAPDNIMLLGGERPLLLDFGAARHVISDMTQALTVILKPGYAPVEQYADIPELTQGPWTDIYALAAVVYTTIAGKTPPPSVGRMMNDTMQPLTKLAAGRYSDAFLRAIDRALAVKPTDRPQSIAEFRDLLGIGVAPPQKTIATPAATPYGTERRRNNTLPPPPPPKKFSPLSLIAALVIVTTIGFGAYLLKDKPAAPQSKPPETALAPAEPPPVARISQPIPAPEPPPPPKAFNALDEIDRIFRERDRDHSMTVQVDKAQVRIGHDRLNFRIRSSRAGYLYVLMVGTDGQHFYKLFPNAVDDNNRVEARKEIILPRKGWTMVAGGPPGANNFVAVVSAVPRNFADSGLVKVDPFAEFPLEAAAALAAKHTGSQSPFLGTKKCPKDAVDCTDAYGAAVFTIEEIN